MSFKIHAGRSDSLRLKYEMLFILEKELYAVGRGILGLDKQ